MGNRLISGIAFVLAIIGTYIPTFGLRQIWKGIWENIFVLPLDWLGYIFLAIGILALLGLVVTNKSRNPNRYVLLIFLALFTIMLALELLIPSWYSATWF